MGNGGCLMRPKAQDGQTSLPKFKFSEKFPIGIHVILELQKKNSKFA